MCTKLNQSFKLHYNFVHRCHIHTAMQSSRCNTTHAFERSNYMQKLKSSQTHASQQHKAQNVTFP